MRLVLAVGSTYVLLLPLELASCLLHFMQPLPEGVVGGGPLCLQVSGGLLQGVVDGLTEPHGALHLLLCLPRVVS